MSPLSGSLDLTPTPSEPAATISITNAPLVCDPESNPSSCTSSDMSDSEPKRPSLVRALTRPKLTSRKSSGTHIIPRDHPEVEIQKESFPADDARAMSPRRSSYETEKLGLDTRKAVQRHAKDLQSGLNALAEKIELVKSDHERLEKQNVALQDYIGGLTRSMSNTAITSTKAKK